MSFPDHSGRYWLPNSEPFDNPHEWLALVFGAIDDSLGREGNWYPDDFAEYIQRDGDLKYLLEQAMQCLFPLESDIVKFFVVSHRENQNVSGGSTASNSYNKHTLNEELSDSDGLVTLNGGDVTIEPGTFLLYGVAYCYKGSTCHAAIYDVTGGQRVAYGLGDYTDPTSSHGHPLHVVYPVVIAASRAYRLEVYTANAQAANGLGPASNVPTERFAYLIGLKIA